MGNYLILNGSPRAPRSNSLQYIQLLRSHLTGSCTEYALLSTDKHLSDALKYLLLYQSISFSTSSGGWFRISGCCKIRL